MSNRYKLTFEYDGTYFNGWQNQPEGRTVQGVIEKALTTFYQQEINIVGQGRTDAGVHAKAQVAHVDLPTLYSMDRLQRAMKGLLPQDVALQKAEKVQDDFHARFQAISRIYEYRITEIYSPLMRNYTWACYKPVSFELLQRCAEMILGEHDFLNFCIPADMDEPNTHCTIHRSNWERNGELMIYQIEGNRFLRHLVRRLVGTMVHVADGTLHLNNFEFLLSAESVNKKGHAAPAKGLTLLRVTY